MLCNFRYRKQLNKFVNGLGGFFPHTCFPLVIAIGVHAYYYCIQTLGYILLNRRVSDETGTIKKDIYGAR